MRELSEQSSNSNRASPSVVLLRGHEWEWNSMGLKICSKDCLRRISTDFYATLLTAMNFELPPTQLDPPHQSSTEHMRLSLRRLQVACLLLSPSSAFRQTFIRPVSPQLINLRAIMTANGEDTTANPILTALSPSDVALEIKDPVDPKAWSRLAPFFRNFDLPPLQVESAKLVEVAQRLGDIPKDSAVLVKTKEECQAAFEALTDQERTALVNIHARVKFFAQAQRASVQDMEVDIPGGKAGHTVSPCKGAC